jgi:hypothetical protein
MANNERIGAELAELVLAWQKTWRASDVFLIPEIHHKAINAIVAKAKEFHDGPGLPRNKKLGGRQGRREG